MLSEAGSSTEFPASGRSVADTSMVGVTTQDSIVMMSNVTKYIDDLFDFIIVLLSIFFSLGFLYLPSRLFNSSSISSIGG